MAWKVKERSDALAIAFHVTAWEMPHPLPSLETISYQAHELTALQGLEKLHQMPVDAVTRDGVEGQRAKRNIGYCVSRYCLENAAPSTLLGDYFLSST